MRNFLKKYNHSWTLLYAFIYLAWWGWLGRMEADRYASVHMWLDDKIPFCEWFIIPYYIWFPYILLVIAYFFFFASRREYYQLAGFLFIGMTVALITYTIWPNGITFRTELSELSRNNILIRLTAFIYANDRAINCCPSIHCFNSIAVCIAINRCASLKHKKAVRIGSIVLSALICLSTVFVKQHSVLDVIWAFVLGAVMYLAAYLIPDWLAARKKKEGKAKSHAAKQVS
ncbi:MAG: phosphatase PAP2 family protein [Lachnospiraceae bacterium]|nr:phosphatase PAP2 family protein [Lachnospiraceae bacterium]